MQLPHNEGYVLASYGVTFIAMILIIGWVWLDSRARQNELKKLEAAGIRRRSAMRQTTSQNKAEENTAS